MANLITKFGYLKPSARQSRGGYVKYIATRDGVEKLDDTQRLAPATAKQKQFIEKLLQDFPDCKEMLEYEDYAARQTMGTASDFISRAMEDNAHKVLDSKTYADYIATRPRAERFGSHGLFTDDGVQVDLQKVSDDLNNHKGNVWTVIISLRREDAVRLGFDHGFRWRDMLRTQTQALAENLKIPMEHLKWFAAFHDESYHPHIHLIAYSSVENEGYLSKQGVMKLRSAFARDIFAQDLLCVYDQQTAYRDELRQVSREKVEELVGQIRAGQYDGAGLDMQLVMLAQRLKHTKGKKVYGYLSAGTKKLVDSIVDDLAMDSRISELYDLWYEQRERIIQTYTSHLPERVSLSQNEEFKAVRNAVVRAAVGIAYREESMEEHPESAGPGYFSREYGGKKSWWTDEYKQAWECLYGSSDSPPKPAQAMELLQREAEKGNGFALYDLGLMAKNGFGCEKNNVLAQERFRKALAAFLDDESRSKKPDYWQYRIGKMYAMGYGTEQDFRKATEWYERAAARNNPFAAYALGCMYRRGQGVERNEARAITYFQAAAARGNEYAQRLLDSLRATSDAQRLSITSAALSLLRQTARIFEDKLQEYYAPQMGHTDRKLLSKIAEKKLAQGQKLGG